VEDEPLEFRSPVAEIALSSRAIAVSQSANATEQRVSELFEQLRGRIYRYVLVISGVPEEAEEVTQESFLRLYQTLRQGTRIDEPQFWLFRVAHNLTINRQRRARFEKSYDFATWEMIAENRADPSPSPEQDAIQREKYESIRNGLARLTDQENRILHLRAEGLRYRQIAEVLGIGKSTVADILRGGIDKLKAHSNA